MRVVCMIPARGKSSRIKRKNLRYLGDKPLVAHVLTTCVRSEVFDEIYLNSDDLIFEQLAHDYNVNFYHRPSKYAEPHVTNDLFVEDFLKNTKCDYVIQVNPTAPFLEISDIKEVFRLLIEEKFETVQSLKEERIEGIFNNQPLNFDPHKIMPESQNLIPVHLYSSGIMGFKKDIYLKNMEKLGAATYGGEGSIGYHTTKGFANIDIDYEDDFQLAEVIYTHLSKKDKEPIRYYERKFSSEKEIADADRERILVMDGVNQNTMNSFNKEKVSITEIIEKNGRNKSWAHTVVNSLSNSATLIAQMPGEGNRLHYHHSWDEWWYIVEGQWEWMVDGESKKVKKGDIVFIERNRKHKITALGNKMAIRLAVSREDVDHVYEQEVYK